MVSDYFSTIEQLLVGLDCVEITNVVHKGGQIHIYVSMKQCLQVCPCCGETSNRIHDYRQQLVHDVPSFGESTILHIKKRRYTCEACGKNFVEDIPFLSKYLRMTSRLSLYIIAQLSKFRTMSDVSKETGVSERTVARIFDYVVFLRKDLPMVMGIDEFKGNSGGEKFQCIVTDLDSRTVFDILPNRNLEDLITYFSSFSSRSKVKIIVMDMSSLFKSLAKSTFPHAQIVADRFHYMRLVDFAFERVRKSEQQLFESQRRKYFKRSKRILMKRREALTSDQAIQVKNMLTLSDRLRRAYVIRQEFFKFLDCKERNSAAKELGRWMMFAAHYDIQEFMDLAVTFSNWRVEILNSFSYPYSNGFTEGYNNKIKVIKRIGFGLPNFERFRKRILHISNDTNNRFKKH